MQKTSGTDPHADERSVWLETRLLIYLYMYSSMKTSLFLYFLHCTLLYKVSLFLYKVIKNRSQSQSITVLYWTHDTSPADINIVPGIFYTLHFKINHEAIFYFVWCRDFPFVLFTRNTALIRARLWSIASFVSACHHLAAQNALRCRHYANARQCCDSFNAQHFLLLM